MVQNIQRSFVKFYLLFTLVLLQNFSYHSQRFGLLNVTLKENPQIKAIARQRFLDFVTDIGIDEFVAHQDSIQVKHVTTQDRVPLLGTVQVDLDDITGHDIVIPRDRLSLTLVNNGFQLESDGISSTFDFLWRWHKGILGGHGDGSLSLINGQINLLFSILQGNDGTFSYKTIAASANYNDVQLKLNATRLNWLYQIILRLFKRSIKAKIEKKIVDFIKNELPDIINQKLAKVPQQIEIAGLPFQNKLFYSVYSSQYILFEGFEQIKYSSYAPPQQKDKTRLSTVQKNQKPQTRPIDNNKPDVSGNLTQQLSAIKSIMRSQYEECQYRANPLIISPTEIASSGDMFTGFLHSSFFQCALWALYNEGKLHKTVKDGDIKGLHLITDLFIVLIPGIESDYPGHSMQIQADSLQVPDVQLLDDSQIYVSSNFQETFYVVEPTPTNRNKRREHQGQISRADQNSIDYKLEGQTEPQYSLIEVAKMNVKLNVTAQMSFNATKIKSVEVKHEVVNSKYNISPARWDYTVKYALTMYGNRITIESVANKYLNLNIKQLNISVVNTEIVFFNEWAKVQGDFKINNYDLR